MTPRVSVLIPSHRSDMLQQSMGSVLHQTYKDYQLLVGYCDADWWPTKLNELAQAAVGEFVLILPDDDILLEPYLERTIAAADAEGADIVYTNWRRMRGPLIWDWNALAWNAETMRNGGCNPVCGATYLIRRTLWNEIGGTPNVLFWDWAFAIECYLRGAKAVHVPEPLVIFREHENKTTVDNTVAMQQLRDRYDDFWRAVA